MQKFSGATPKDADRLQRALAACPQAIVFWSRQSEDWVFDLLDLPALADRLGPGRLCVYAAGEASAEKAGFTTKMARVVQAVLSSGEAELHAFLGAPGGGT